MLSDSDVEYLVREQSLHGQPFGTYTAVPGRQASRPIGEVRVSEASYEQLAQMVSIRLMQDCKQADGRLKEIKAQDRALDEKIKEFQELEDRIRTMSDVTDEVIELNVGGQPMTTSRSVLCLAEGSLLAGMFSGNFESGHKKDKEGRIFLDVDPPIFERVLSHLRFCRIAMPDCPAPLPHVPEDLKAEYDMTIKYLGLEAFMNPISQRSGNIFEMIAELERVPQNKLQSSELVTITLSTSGGVPTSAHEEVIGPTGFHDRSLENSYGTHPGVITIKFLKHRVRVDAFDLRAKVSDIPWAHMSNTWDFMHGSEKCRMKFSFTKANFRTGKLQVPAFRNYVDEISWSFTGDFCLEHILVFGRVIPMNV